MNLTLHGIYTRKVNGKGHSIQRLFMRNLITKALKYGKRCQGITRPVLPRDVVLYSSPTLSSSRTRVHIFGTRTWRRTRSLRTRTRTRMLRTRTWKRTYWTRRHRLVLLTSRRHQFRIFDKITSPVHVLELFLLFWYPKLTANQQCPWAGLAVTSSFTTFSDGPWKWSFWKTEMSWPSRILTVHVFECSFSDVVWVYHFVPRFAVDCTTLVAKLVLTAVNYTDILDKP